MNIESIKKIDLGIIVLVFLLCLIGGLNVFATTYFPEKESSGLFYNQLIYYFVGLFLLVVLTVLNYKNLNKLLIQIAVFIGVLSLLVIVLVVGEYVLGAKRWINIGGFTIQPSEFAKIGLIVLSSFILSIQKPVFNKRRKSKLYRVFINNFTIFKILGSFLVLVIFDLLIIAQNSLGNSLLLAGIWFIIFISHFPINAKYVSVILALLSGLFVSFEPVNILGPDLSIGSFSIPIAGIAIFTCLVVIMAKIVQIKPFLLLLPFFFVLPARFGLEYAYNNAIQDYQRARIEAFINPEVDPTARWNKDQAKIALGSGKVFGKGFLKGTHTNYKFLPFSYNDFAFASLGEQFGFIGLFIVGGLFGLLLGRITKIARETKDIFGRTLVFGVSAMIFLNMFQHMGMNVGILPITGVPLPFISYGGSSVLVMMIGIGLVLSVAIHGERFSNVRKHEVKSKFTNLKSSNSKQVL